MLYKSTDESLATVDISCFDLHTGRTELFKGRRGANRRPQERQDRTCGVPVAACRNFA